MKSLKRLISWLISKFGRRVRDDRTGEFLGRALVLNLPGRTWLIGLHSPYVRAVFLPNPHNRYAQARIGFATHAPVDFPSIFGRKSRTENQEGEIARRKISGLQSHPSAFSSPPPSRILWAILFHQDPQACRAVLEYWQRLGYHDLLVVHGGSESDFQALDYPDKVFVPDTNLRTRSHPVEKQSYSGPLREIRAWLESRPEFTHICLAEYDHIPLVPDWAKRLLEFLSVEDADVLFHHLQRVDGTNAPHYLQHLRDIQAPDIWPSSSLREDSHVVLNALATGSFWKREALDAVARNPEPFPVYLEMHLPTTAHHLGFRVRDYADQNPFIHIGSYDAAQIRSAAGNGAWSIHPVKDPADLPQM